MLVNKILNIWQDNTGAESGTVLSNLEEHPEIVNKIGRDTREDGQDNANENDVQVDIEVIFCLITGIW